MPLMQFAKVRVRSGCNDARRRCEAHPLASAPAMLATCDSWRAVGCLIVGNPDRKPDISPDLTPDLNPLSAKRPARIPPRISLTASTVMQLAASRRMTSGVKSPNTLANISNTGSSFVRHTMRS